MCPRNLNWQPLGLSDDPVPGCPERIDVLVDEYRTSAQRIDDCVGVLEQIENESSSPDVWESDAADRFVELQREVRPDLSLLAERYEVAAGALEDYASELRIAQTESEEALHAATTTQEQVDEARLDSERKDVAEDAGEEWTGDDPEAATLEAEQQLEDARDDLTAAIRRRDQAAEVAAAAISEHVEGDGLQNPDLGSAEAQAAMLARLEEDPTLWKDLSEEDRQRLIEEHPEIVGMIDGIPATDRDAANRLHMERAKADLEAQRAALEAAGESTEEVDKQLAAIGVLEERLGQAPDGREAYLLGFSPEPEARAIVAIGNPDTADNVLTHVPGTGTEFSGGLRGQLERVDAMAADARELDPNADTSTVMWLGYDAPSETEAPYPERAEAGAEPLRDFQAGLQTAHEGGGANYTVSGHSYGSTVIGHAARDGGLVADNMIFQGSPGVGVDHVSDLGIDPDHVFVTAAARDPIARTPSQIHGPPPTRDSFGATEFTSEVPGFSINPLAPHSSYWDNGNVARDNMAAITTGNHDLVETGRNTSVGGHVVEGTGVVAEGVGTAAETVVDGVNRVREGIESLPRPPLPWG